MRNFRSVYPVDILPRPPAFARINLIDIRAVLRGQRRHGIFQIRSRVNDVVAERVELAEPREIVR